MGGLAGKSAGGGWDIGNGDAREDEPCGFAGARPLKVNRGGERAGVPTHSHLLGVCMSVASSIYKSFVGFRSLIAAESW